MKLLQWRPIRAKNKKLWFSSIPQQNPNPIHSPLFDNLAQLCHQKDLQKAMGVMNVIEDHHLRADPITYSSLIKLCIENRAVNEGRRIHRHLSDDGRPPKLFLSNSLLSILAEANAVFQRMKERDVISWSTMISGLAQNGRSIEALRLFESMKAAGPKPNYITMVGVLFACSHAGLVEDGWKLEEALNFIDSMGFQPDCVIWRTLLGACRVHRNSCIAVHAAKEILKLEPEDEGTYILLSNIYADSRRWNDVEQVRKAMRDQGVRKEPGRSWMEVGKKAHVFIVGDFSHPEMDCIIKELNRLIGRITDVGYVPDVKFVLHDLEESRKRNHLGITARNWRLP
ncbi:hypothetical protein J5N97_000002 [Dioscorea zingiberensis]|uniref:Pentatricopeptide repeat-containing protein n=1 Tax=Dioscorea zingiberensis TaxID=325984 RepID=A0A9D5H3A4_9LILI|nr:hypothetical protein J5N97_000002 [Dioscorea zingiberensis]